MREGKLWRRCGTRSIGGLTRVNDLHKIRENFQASLLEVLFIGLNVKRYLPKEHCSGCIIINYIAGSNVCSPGFTNGTHVDKVALSSLQLKILRR